MHCDFTTKVGRSCCLGLLLSVAAVAGAAAPVLETPALLLRFDATSGHLVELLDKAQDHNHIDLARPAAVWSAAFTTEPPTAIAPDQAGRFSWKVIEAPRGGLELTWDGFELEDAPGLAVRVTVSAVDSGLSRWSIAFENLEGLQPAAVRFPRIDAIAHQPHEILAIPYWMGEQTTKARQLLSPQPGQGHRREWLYPGILSMQCITLYGQGGSGLYVAADDTQALSKSFAVFGDGHEGMGLELTHFPAADARIQDRYEPGYGSLLGTFQGDWITAAEMYRRWALAQPWAQASRLHSGATPGWVLDTGFWVWNRGRSGGVLAPATVLQDYMEMPVSVFWHWWHGCPYDVGFPEYLPPREGAEPFRQALATAQDAGIHAIVYMNQRLWGMTTESWAAENAVRFAVKRPDGQVQPEVYNTFTQSPCASMCMGTAFWREKYAGLAKEAFHSLGVNGIYMDQACSSLVCYDPNHAHAPGGGSYWMEGFRTLEADIRTRCEGIALAGEGVGEAWLPHLDLMLNLQVSMERYAAPGAWEPIPFFHAVYHGYAVFYGNYASLTYPPYDELWPPESAPEFPLRLLDPKFIHQFRLEQARSFVWGQQPCLANFLPEHLESRRDEMRFLKHLAQLRMAALKYLLHGAFVRPPDIALPPFEAPISRLSIYAGQRDAVQEYSKTIPSVLAGAWLAEDGDLAVAVANITDEPHPIRFVLSAAQHGLPESGIVYRRLPGQLEELAAFAGGRVEIDDTLEAASACLYEFAAR